MVRKSILLLLALLILGFTIRVYRINQMPMYGDELTIVYDTYSILKTGKDATGESFPLTFRMGAGRPGGYIYTSLPFVYLFGPSEWGVRGLSIFSSLGIIVLIFFLGKKLFNEKVGLIASFLTSISLWDIYLARGGFEAHFALFLALLGITSFIYGKYVFWAISWGLAVLTYPTFKLTLPLMFLILVWFEGPNALVKNKFFIVSIVILTLFGGIVVRETLTGRSEERFLKINILSDSNLKQQIIQKVNEERTLSTVPNFVKLFFYNKPLKYSRILLENYIDSVSLRFLFLRGDGNPRHNPGEWGMLYLIELPLLLFGIFSLWKEKKKEFTLLIFWILITPLATMLLSNTHALRNALMLPALILISAYALNKLSKKTVSLFVFLMLIQLIFILQRVYFLAPNKFASFWSADAKKASLETINIKNSGKVITLLTKIDNIEYAYPVYAKIDPNLVIGQYGKYP
ncbi:MAG: glycosyltransferase family 39 protein, partial [Patescibacteria group bacterium]